MSLDWAVEDVKDWETVCWIEGTKPDTKRLNPITEILIWATMHVGINEITEKNAEKFHSRLMQLHEIGQAIGYNKDGDYTPSLEEIKQHIGLGTNASCYNERKWKEVLKRRSNQ
jgi:hypothetical protein